MALNMGPKGNEPHSKPRFISSSQEDRGGSLADGISKESGAIISRHGQPDQKRNLDLSLPLKTDKICINNQGIGYIFHPCPSSFLK